ncbi:hypothetical protein [Sinorhizobium meliloti]|uniref:hypothetical protein n=1 Tax=Rhizobium meliloti TaxID=382 RepID=UPI0013E3B51D|nr:hypothetical protein [Sinorhizobium meliloti]
MAVPDIGNERSARRNWSLEDKWRIVEEAQQFGSGGGASALVAERTKAQQTS